MAKSENKKHVEWEVGWLGLLSSTRLFASFGSHVSGNSCRGVPKKDAQVDRSNVSEHYLTRLLSVLSMETYVHWMISRLYQWEMRQRASWAAEHTAVLTGKHTHWHLYAQRHDQITQIIKTHLKKKKKWRYFALFTYFIQTNLSSAKLWF